LHERANERQFGGKRAFFLKVASSFRRLCRDQFGISPKECAEGRTSIIGNKADFPNYSVPIIVGGDMGVDKWSNHMRSNFFIFSVDK
jgi:hypothetical protein